MVGTVRVRYLLDDLSKDLIGLAATRSHQLRTRSERRSFTIIASPVVLSKLFHQKTCRPCSAQGGPAFLHHSSSRPQLRRSQKRNHSSPHFASERRFSWELLRAGIEKAPFRIGDSFLEGSVFFRISSHQPCPYDSNGSPVRIQGTQMRSGINSGSETADNCDSAASNFGGKPASALHPIRACRPRADNRDTICVLTRL